MHGLPADLAAAIFVVLHVPAEGTSALPAILTRSGQLEAVHPSDCEPVRHGRIYVAPPDRHLLVHRGFVRVLRGPRENGARPAVDPLFRTAARAYGSRVVAVVLSGNLDDGAAGVLEVKERGGVVVVQDPGEAAFSGMPRNTIEYSRVDHSRVDHCLTLADIPKLLVRLSHESVNRGEPPRDPLGPDRTESQMTAMDEEKALGVPSAFVCPECDGTLWELRDGDLLQFRCRVGHVFSAESALVAESDALERALWTALRSLEENAGMARRMARHARERRNDFSAARFDRRTEDLEAHILSLRQILEKSLSTLSSES